MDIAAYARHRLRGSSIPMEVQALIREAVPGRANGLHRGSCARPGPERRSSRFALLELGASAAAWTAWETALFHLAAGGCTGPSPTDRVAAPGPVSPGGAEAT